MFLFSPKSNLKEEEYCLDSIMKMDRICPKSQAETVFKVCMTVITLGLNVLNVL